MGNPASGSEAEIVLNPELDRAALARRFAQSGRIQIRDFMTRHYAESTHDVLQNEVPWSLVYNKGKENIELKPAQLSSMSSEEIMTLHRGAVTRARDEFQFLYHTFMILNSYKAGEFPGHPLYGLFEYINGEEFLGLVREVTGLPGLVKVDAQATLYRPGNFLTLHDDQGKLEEGWRLAYVMSFAKKWRADWGGLLHFYEEDGQGVTETFVPRFNALSIFRVPTFHSVSIVSPFAPHGRFSIAGWFYDR